MIFIRNDFEGSDAATHEIIALGRIHFVAFRPTATQRGLAVFNIHNDNITSSVITEMRRAIARLRTSMHDVFLLGDFNFGGDAAPTLHTASDGTMRRFRDTRERNRWQRALASLTEISHDLPTRAATQRTERGVVTSHSAIDRAFTSVSPATLAHTRATARADPIHLALPTPTHAPASDHVPVTGALTTTPITAPQFRPTPTWVTRHPALKARLQTRLSKIPLAALHPHDALRRTRQAIGAEGAAVRNICMQRQPRSNGEITQAGLQAARAAHRGDATAFRRELQRWPALRRTADDSDGSIHINDDDAFHRLIGAAIADPASLTPARRPGQAAASAPGPDGAPRRRAPLLQRPAMRRWMALWLPHLRRQSIAQILPDGADAAHPDDPPTRPHHDGDARIALRD